MLKKSEKKYPEYTAGNLAIVSVPVLVLGNTVADVEELLKKEIRDLDSINYVYVVSEENKLNGVISIRDVLYQPKETLLEDIMTKKIISVRPRTDQEQVSNLALKHNIKAIPVIDRSGTFLGVVPNDTILDVMYEEAQEDISHIAGVTTLSSEESTLSMPIKMLLLHRLPWLFAGLLGTLGIAKLVGLFENTLTENIILASFLPMVLYMGGSALSQTQLFFIRDLAMFPKLNFKKYLTKQIYALVIIALIFSLLAMVVGVAFFDYFIARTLGITLFAVICSTFITSLIIPYLFFKLNLDPAGGSGPVATIVQDFIGISIYLSIAVAFI